MDVHAGERFFWFSTTGWVMWNLLQGSLLLGATPVLYDGSPGYPDLDVLWQFAEDSKMSVFGTSAAYLTTCMGQGLEADKHVLCEKPFAMTATEVHKLLRTAENGTWV